MHKSGAFDDIDVILVNDILDQKYRSAVIKSIDISVNSKNIYSYSYTLLAEGKEYKYNSYINGANTGSVVQVRISGGNIIELVSTKNPDVAATFVQAFDTKRIKIYGKVYWFKNTITVYTIDYSGNVTVGSIADISVNDLYGSVALYLDKSESEGGKADIL